MEFYFSSSVVTLENIIFFQLNRISPDTEAEFYCRSGIDKDCFEVRYISDYKGIKLLILTCIHGR